MGGSRGRFHGGASIYTFKGQIGAPQGAWGNSLCKEQSDFEVLQMVHSD